MDKTNTVNKTNKSYTFLLIADFISSFGSSMTNVAVTIYIFSITQDLLLAALFPLVSLLPRLIITPFVNKFHINGSYKALFIVGEILAGITISSMLWLKNIYVMLAVFALYSAIFFVLELYRAEYLKIISTDAKIVSRKSISQVVNSFVEVVAPIVAGIVLQMLGSNLVFIIDVISYIIAALIILFIDNTKIINCQPEILETKKKATFKNLLDKIKLTKNSNIFIGTLAVTFIGGVTSLLTLSYVLHFLKSSEIIYTVLIALLSLGSMLGSALVNIKFFQKNSKSISSICLLLDGILLFSVLLKPNAQLLGAILFVSGILSSLVMTYYGIQIYLNYSQETIKSKFAVFQICINSSSALSQPVGGVLEKAFGNIISISIMGVMFIIFSPINYLWDIINKFKNKHK